MQQWIWNATICFLALSLTLAVFGGAIRWWDIGFFGPGWLGLLIAPIPTALVVGLALDAQLKQAKLHQQIAAAQERERNLQSELEEERTRTTVLLSRALLERDAIQRGVFACQGVVVDTDAITARKDGVRITLTATEFEILALLASKSGHVVKRADIESMIWGCEYVCDGLVSQHVHSIRKKIGSGSDVIKTFRGLGYCFCPEQLQWPVLQEKEETFN